MRKIKPITDETWLVSGVEDLSRLASFVRQLHLLFPDDAVVALVTVSRSQTVRRLQRSMKSQEIPGSQFSLGTWVPESTVTRLPLTEENVKSLADLLVHSADLAWNLSEIHVYCDGRLLMDGSDLCFFISAEVSEETMQRFCASVPCVFDPSSLSTDDVEEEEREGEFWPGWQLKEFGTTSRMLRNLTLLFPENAVLAVPVREIPFDEISDFLRSRQTPKKHLSEQTLLQRERALRIRALGPTEEELERQAQGMLLPRDILPDELQIDVTPENMQDLADVLEPLELEMGHNILREFYVHTSGQVLFVSHWNGVYISEGVSSPQVRSFCKAANCRYSRIRRRLDKGT